MFALASTFRLLQHLPSASTTKKARTRSATFDTIAFVATSLARANREKDAWKVIQKAVNVWWPVDILQVAPVALLTDPDLRGLMTPERCAQVLKTPRGPEGPAARKKK